MVCHLYFKKRTIITVLSLPPSQMSAASSGPTPLGQLLSKSFTFLQSYWKPVLTGAVIFGTLGALVTGTLAGTAAVSLGGVVNEMGMDANKLQELSLRMQNGDESAMTEMEAILDKNVGMMGDDAKGMMVGKMLAIFAPLIGMAGLLFIIIAIFANAYFLLLAISPTQDAMSVLKKTPALFFPLLGTWIWVLLRSFIWIPFLGVIIAIIIGPRFALAPVLLVKEKKGVLKSVSTSYEVTRGYWGKIVGNMIVAGLCVAVAGIVAGMVIGIVSFMVPVVGLWLHAILKEVFSAFMIAFGVMLSLTIMANPLKVSRK